MGSRVRRPFVQREGENRPRSRRVFIDVADFLLRLFLSQGYMDVKITVGTSGGHSSVPPPHSGIGIVGDIVHAIEVS